MTPNLKSLQIAPIRRQRLGDQVADVLRGQILLGALKPGALIPEREMAAEIGVSRTPLREALLVLESEGLIEMSPAKSPSVANPSATEVIELLQVQAALEGLAGECACDEASDSEIEAIAAMHSTMLDMYVDGNPVEYFKIDMGFHEAIVAATKNQALIKTHGQYQLRLWRARSLSARRMESRKMAMSDHGLIVEGLQRRDKAQVSGAMVAHLKQAIEKVRVIFAEEEAASAMAGE